MRPALLIGCLLLGCSSVPSSVDAGLDAGEPEVTPVELCNRLAIARCGLLSRCYAAFAQRGFAGCSDVERETCLAGYEVLRPAFEGKRVAIDGARLGGCEARMKSSSCPPTFPPSYSAIAAHPFSDCDLETGLLTGKVVSGQTCATAVECEPGSVCIKPGGVCKGTCSKWPQVGEACSFGCEPGLICDNDRCAAARTTGQTCASSRECAPDLICNGTCRARSKASEACAFDANRLSTCDPGLACDVTPFVMGVFGKCVVPQPLNGRCQFHWSCASGLVCADLDFTGFPSNAPTPGFCRLPGEPGTNCPATTYQTFVGDQCGAGTVCSNDLRKCTALPKKSEACTPSTQSCAGVGIYCKPSGSGDTGLCTGPVGNGDRCAFEIDATRRVSVPCATGYCDTVSTFSCQPPVKANGSLCEQNGECQSGRCAVQQDRSLRCAQACN